MYGLWVWMATPMYTGESVAKPFTDVWGPRMFALWINGLRSDAGSVWASKEGSQFLLLAPCHLIKEPLLSLRQPVLIQLRAVTSLFFSESIEHCFQESVGRRVKGCGALYRRGMGSLVLLFFSACYVNRPGEKRNTRGPAPCLEISRHVCMNTLGPHVHSLTMAEEQGFLSFLFFFSLCSRVF